MYAYVYVYVHVHECTCIPEVSGSEPEAHPEGATPSALEGTKGVPRTGVVTAGLMVCCSQFFTGSNPHFDRCSNPLPYEPGPRAWYSSRLPWGLLSSSSPEMSRSSEYRSG